MNLLNGIRKLNWQSFLILVKESLKNKFDKKALDLKTTLHKIKQYTLVGLMSEIANSEFDFELTLAFC